MTASGFNIFCVGIIQSYGTGSAQWSITGGTRSYMTFTVTSPKTINLGSDFNMGSGLSVAMTVNSGAILDASTYKMSFGNAGLCRVYGTVRTSNPNGLFGSSSTTLTNTTANLQFAPQTGSTVEYYATGSQDITDTSVYENVIISGTGTKTLTGATTINKTLTLSSGGNKLNIQNYILTIPSGGSIGTCSSADYIVTGTGAGRLRQNAVAASSARVFPVGNANYYLPVTLTPNTSSSDFSVNVFQGATQEGVDGGTSWSTYDNIVNANWNIDRNAGTGMVDVKINWNDALEGSYFAAMTDAQITMWRRVTGTTWSVAAATIAPNSNGSNYSTAIAAGNFTTQYMVAWLQGILPIKLAKFSAIRSYNHNFISWEMENARSIEHFEVERSENASSFTSIGSITSSNNTNYSFTDRTAADDKTYYYRLKLVASGGAVEYSQVVALKGIEFRKFTLCSNLVNTELQLKHAAADQASYRVITSDGKIISSAKIVQNALITTVDVSKLPAGIYMVQYINNGQVITERFMKQ
jgi:hypothetical protein